MCNNPSFVSILVAVFVSLVACTSAPPPTTEEYCDAVTRCSPPASAEPLRTTCLSYAGPLREVSNDAGCGALLDEGLRCTVDYLLDAECDAIMEPAECAPVLADYSTCLIDSGAIETRACMLSAPGLSSCVETPDIPGIPSLCDSTGVELEACPTAGARGRCTFEEYGITSSTTYYDPLPAPNALETYATGCMESGGTWAAF